MPTTSTNRLVVRTVETFEIRTPERAIFHSERSAIPWNDNYGQTQLAIPHEHEIRFKSERTIQFSVWNHKHWLANVTLAHGIITVNNNYRLHGTTAECVHINDVVRDLSAGVRLILLGTGVLHRVDIKMAGGTWFSMFVFGRDILTVRPNGQFLHDRLENAFHHVSAKTLSYERTHQDLQFVISNESNASRLVKRVDCNEQGTQTCHLIQPVTAQTLNEAVEQAISKITAQCSHPWAMLPRQIATTNRDGEGAQSLAAQSLDSATVASSSQAPSREGNSRAAQRARGARRENLLRFGGLFDYVKRESDADDESD